MDDTLRASTESLTAVFIGEHARIQIYQVKNSQHGWVERKMKFSSVTVPLETFNESWIMSQISGVINKWGNTMSKENETYWEKQIKNLMLKSMVTLIRK
tara:strand:+ start:237 stop:533 length:297 start_codon:yes stop_codon:yes gene_type:complete